MASYAATLNIPDFSVSSAGTRAVIGHAIQEEAAVVLDRLGGDAGDFAARQLKPAIASRADLILTMTTAHRDAVLELAPHKFRTTYTLIEAARLVAEHEARTIADFPALRPYLVPREPTDVPDPIGQSAEVFASVGSQIAELLRPVVELCLRSSRPSTR